MFDCALPVRGNACVLGTQSLQDFFNSSNADAQLEVFKFFLYNSCMDCTEVLPDGSTALHLAVKHLPNNIRVIAAVLEEGGVYVIETYHIQHI
jgi:hypothetical protein